MFKIMMVFQQATVVSDPLAPARRIAGWTEGFYDSDEITVVRNDLNTLCRKRALLLPKGASIIGQRIQQVFPTVGPVQSYSVLFPGNPGFSADIPQMALLCSAQGNGVRNTRQVTLRGIPDELVVEGELKPSQDFTRAFGAYANWVQGYRFRGKDLTQISYPLLSIDAAGHFFTEGPNTIPDGSMVRVLRATNAAGKRIGGRFKVQVQPETATKALIGWTAGACTGGQVRIDLINYPAIDAPGLSISRIVTRRVGRPSGQYRGRATKKKK